MIPKSALVGRRFSLPVPLCIAALASLAFAVGVAAAVDPGEIREAEIRECRAGDLATWGDGRDRPAPSRQMFFAYNPTNAPADFSRDEVVAMVRKAMSGWAACGLQLDWAEWMPTLEAAPDVRVIGWMPASEDSGGLIGGADFVRRRLLLSPKVFAVLKARNPTLMQSTLQMTLSHEIGHFLGLVAHSRRCVDVTSYYHDGKGRHCLTENIGGIRSVKGVIEYRSDMPTACDIARCRRANGLQ
ncbi:MAG: hypothetical protein IPH08_17595 [Rhodocyclaceae bacterium]|nr:hypothetical protein [Rhodocyclaceae bacterium]